VLTGIGARLSAGQIRYRIVDAQGIWPDTVMPSYYRTRATRLRASGWA
jgi:sulfur-oxidizing protein SoxX